jgi:hypothetical protein
MAGEVDPAAEGIAAIAVVAAEPAHTGSQFHKPGLARSTTPAQAGPQASTGCAPRRCLRAAGPVAQIPSHCPRTTPLVPRTSWSRARSGPRWWRRLLAHPPRPAGTGWGLPGPGRAPGRQGGKDGDAGGDPAQGVDMHGLLLGGMARRSGLACVCGLSSLQRKPRPRVGRRAARCQPMPRLGHPGSHAKPLQCRCADGPAHNSGRHLRWTSR